MSFTQFITQLGSAGAGGDKYWWIEMGNGGNFNDYDAYQAPKNAIDSSGNMYANLTYYNSSVSDNSAVFTKFDPNGQLQWSKQLTVSGDCKGRGCLLDSNEDIIGIGQLYSSSDGYGHRLWVAKINSSGTLQWLKNTGGPTGDTNNSPTPYGLALDNSNNIYISGHQGHTGYADLWLGKYLSSNGQLLWDREIYGGPSLSTEAWSVGVDSGGNPIMVGYEENIVSSYDQGYIQKFNTTGNTISWGKRFNYDTSYYLSKVYDVAVNKSTNDIYVSGYMYENATSYVHGFVTKLNSSGTVQWTRTVESFVNRLYGEAITYAPDGYLYVVCRSSNATPQYCVILKLDPSDGSIVAELKMACSVSGMNIHMRSISATTEGYVFISGYRWTTNYAYENVVAKLPSDLSITGSYSVGADSDTLTFSDPNVTFSTHTATIDSFTFANNNAAGFTEVASPLGTFQTLSAFGDYTVTNL